MRRNKTTYIVGNKETEFMIEAETERQSEPERVYRRLLTILNKGNNAEVKQGRDGSLNIYEVKKSKIM